MSTPFFVPQPTRRSEDDRTTSKRRFEPYEAPGPVTLGKPAKPVRALAFSGGLFDTAMQLGVAHALLVSRAEPPEIIVGVSTGAVNAVALAEILQAGVDKPTDQPRLEAQVARFREILEAYREARDEIRNAVLPDIYQVDARRPLKPTDLPIHSEEERQKRARAAGSRAGLIQLTNDLLRIDVSMGAITRGVRALLGLRAACEQRKLVNRIGAYVVEAYRLWLVIFWNIGKLALIGAPLFSAVFAPMFDWLARLPKAVVSLLDRGWVKRTGLAEIVDRVRRSLSERGTGRDEGSTAGGLVFRSKWVGRYVRATVRWLFGFTILSPISVAPPAVAVGLLAALADSLADSFPASNPRTTPLAAHALSWFHWHSLLVQSSAVAGFSLVYLGLFYLLLRWVGLDRILAVYRIDDGLFDPHAIRNWFVRIFDPDYYGRVPMADVVEAAISQGKAKDGTRSPKRLEEYSQSSPQIYVRPMAANLQTTELEVLDGEAQVVDALLASTAYPPFFEAQKCGHSWYIDGSVVAHEPIRALVSHLTTRINHDSTCLDVYPVSSIPLANTELGGGRETYSGIIDIAKRARELENFRDATLDRRMTTLVSQTLPGTKAVWWSGRDTGQPATGKRYLRANVFPIDVNGSKSVDSRLAEAPTIEDRRQVIAEAVADGCRSSLEVMLHQDIASLPGKSVSCRALISERVDKRFLPGAGGATEGPGLPEVCRACALRATNAVADEQRQSLRVPEKRRPELPVWPAVGDESVPARALRELRDRAEDEERGRIREAHQQWPRSRLPGASAKQIDKTRPTISLLFSGGVFRGVYLAGVINALDEALVRPDLIAGSSIGSITAAMAARVFSEEDRLRRKRQIVDVAATYIAVDRLVLTDRFSDFIRNFTLRAASTGFSLRDLDTAFRAFDRSGTNAYGDQMRNVLAGVERLFYISPFEARDAVKAFRLRRYAEAHSLLEAYVQEWLERGGVGLEILGAEPLAILIREHVLNEIAARGPDPAAGFAELLRTRGIQFIATATNITCGRLDINHLPAVDPALDGTRAIDALLASSAFPGVFRPRWSWEVNPKTSAVEQFIDGGVMDNLPLDAVADFLNEARHQHRIEARPLADGVAVPHLLFTGSLEVEGAELSPQRTEELARHWRRIRVRAAELKYNKKIDNYAQTQRDLRRVCESLHGATQPYVPLDLEVVCVKPKWLCGTFAFHPMLGFKRVDQARSIAHGCMTTLKRLDQLGREQPKWVNAWGIEKPTNWSDTPVPKRDEQGQCWYREGCVCPFSKQGLDSIEGTQTLKDATRKALTVIYTE